MSDTAIEKPVYEQALRNVLKQVRVNDEVIESIVDSYRYDPQLFETNPWGMYNWLIGFGIREDGAKAATERFFAMITNTPMSGFGKQKGMSTPFGTVASPDIWGSQGGGNDLMQQMMMQMMMQNMRKPQEDDDDRQMLKFAKQLALIKQITQPAQPQQAMNPFGMGMPFGMQQGVVYEPAVGKDGKAIINPETNMPVYTFRMTPSDKDKRDSATDSIIGRLLESERDRSGRLEEKVLDMITDKQSQDLVDMRRQLQYMQNRTSSESFMEDYARMRQAFPELFGQGKSGNPEVDKLALEIEKWKSEQEFELERDRRRQDFEMKKWLEEKKTEHELAQQSRQQIRELGATLREGITSIAAPMARAASAGMMEAQSLATPAPPSARGDGYRQQSQADSDEIDVSRLSDQELVETYQRASAAKGEIETAHDMLAREIEQRRQQAIHHREATSAAREADEDYDMRDRHASPSYPAPPSAYRHVEEEFDPFDIGAEYGAD